MPYTGKLSKIPHGWALCDGSNGTPNLSGRFLEGVLSGAGQLKEAGLPNIIGGFWSLSYWEYSSPSGVFKNGRKALSKEGKDGENNLGENWYIFDASLSTPIYGRSNTVQPASYTVYYIMRIK